MYKKIKNLLREKVEKFEVFEENLQIKIENVSIKVEDLQNLSVFCEVFPRKGTNIHDNIAIEFVLYDFDGSIIDKAESHIYSDDFFGLEVVEAEFYSESDFIEDIDRIRIFPKKL